MAEIAIAAAIGAAISAATYTVTALLAPRPKPVERGRLQGEVQLQDSSYGHMLAILLGGNPVDQTGGGPFSSGDVTWSQFLNRSSFTEGPGTRLENTGPDDVITSNNPVALSLQTMTAPGDEFTFKALNTAGSMSVWLVESDITNDFSDAPLYEWLFEWDTNDCYASSMDGAGNYEDSAGPFTYTASTVFGFRWRNDGFIELTRDGAVVLVCTTATPATLKLNVMMSINDTSPGGTDGAIIDEVEFATDAVQAVEPGGGMRVAGNIVYLSEIRKVETITPGSGGKGGPRTPDTKNIEYFADIGIMFSEGTMLLDQLYADSDLLLDINQTTGAGTGMRDPLADPDPDWDNIDLIDPSDTTTNNLPGTRYGATPAYSSGVLTTSIAGGGNCTLRFYQGTETQPVDPILEAAPEYAGVGNTPAFLGRCWIMLENFNLSKYGRIPNFTACLSNALYRTAAECITHLCDRVDMDPADYDVSNVDDFWVRGIPIFNRTAPREVIKLIGEIFAFDTVEANGEIKCVLRGGAPSVTIDEADLGVGGDNQDPQSADIPTMLENALQLDQTELPKRIDVKFFDPLRKGEANSIGVVRLGTLASGEETRELNAVLLPTEARQIAQRFMDTAWTEGRQELRFNVPHTFTDLEPAVVANIVREDVTHTIRVKDLTGFIPGPLDITGVATRANAYVQTEIVMSEDGTGVIDNPLPPVPATSVVTFIDRILRDRELQAGRPGFYVAACSFGNGQYGGVNVYRDQGGYQHVINVPEQATMGVVVATPATIAGASTIDVDLYGTQSLDTYTAGEVTAGAGYILVGDLVLQYEDAVQLSTTPNRWRLTTLSNIGARCTTAENGSHAAGERFVVLNTALRFVAIEADQIGVAYDYKAPTVGQDIADAGVINFTVSAPNTTPPSAAPFGSGFDSTTNELFLTWTPVTSDCVMLDGLRYEIHADSAGSPGALIWSGNATEFRQVQSVSGTVTWHFRVVTNHAEGAYGIFSQTFTVTATPTLAQVPIKVRAATTAALPAHTRSGNVLTASANGALAAQDGITLVANNRLLVKDEAGSHLEHGPYAVTQVGSAGTPWILTRVAEADSTAEVTASLMVLVAEGTTQADSIWLLTTDDPITLNTTALTFEEHSAGGGGAAPTRVLWAEWDGRGVAIDAGTIQQGVIPFSPITGTITEIYIKDLDDTAGTCEIDVRKAARGSAPPGAGDSICGGSSNRPNTSAQSESTKTTFSGWSTTTINANDEVRFVITSNATHQRLWIGMTVTP